MKRSGDRSARTTSRIALGMMLLAIAGSAAISSSTPADDNGWLIGTWHGERRGYPVTWSFAADGHMLLEDRGARWSVHNDTLVVDFDPLGESEMTERAVYRFLTSDTQRGVRHLFLRGFDLGSGGLLLTREHERTENPNETGSKDAGAAGARTHPFTKAPRRAP